MPSRRMLALTLTLGVTAATAQAQDYSGRLLPSEDVSVQGFVAFNIWVEEYTTNEERSRYLQLLLEGGPGALEIELANQDVGRFQVVGQLASRLGYAYEFPREDGGRTVMFVSPRPLHVFQGLYLSQSREFPFGVIQLNLDEEGVGDGVIFGASRIRFDDEQRLEVTRVSTGQTFTIQTVRDR